MKKTILGIALLAAVVMTKNVSAQEFDNRWYVSGTAGVLIANGDRNTYNDALYGIGFGKRITPRIAFDIQYDQSTLNEKYVPGSVDYGDLNWDLQALQVFGRYYFLKQGRAWNPYLGLGLGSQHHSEEYPDPGNGGTSDVNKREGTDFIGTLGVGIETDRRKRIDFRVEAGARYDNDQFEEDDNGQAKQYGGYVDLYATASILVKLGDLPVPVVAAPAPTCDTLDSDNDGVNDCNDKCPNSQAGQTIGADGCPVKLTIDLKGVNFDFDKDTLRDDSVVILNEAVAVLTKYPELRVAVDGYTDLCGNDEYNQQLSQKRAAAVYDFMVAAGIDAGRLSGPTGHGEANPLVDTGQAYPGCKNETNRRTELNVQN